MNAKLVWLLEKYNYHSQTHIGGSSSQTHEICDLYLTEKDLHQLHLDEEALRETLEEEARDEKEREEKIRQKQDDDEEFFMEFGVVKYDSEYDLDIDDSDLYLTPVLRPSSSTHVEPSPSTLNPVRIIPGPAVTRPGSLFRCDPFLGCYNIVQQAKLLKEKVFILDSDGDLMSTQEYMQKVVEDVGEDDDFKSGSWVSVTNYVNVNGGTITGCLEDIKNFLKNEKLAQVVAIVKSCSPNVLDDLTVTMKDLSELNFLILDNVSVSTPKPSMHYLNITKKNVVKVFRKDTIPGSDSD
ncbi:transposase, MuDR, MULE transposase domain protein [Tanacetum coccineum]